MMNKKRKNLSIASEMMLEEIVSNLRIVEDLKDIDDKTPGGRASAQSQYNDGSLEAQLVGEDGPGFNLEQAQFLL